MRQSALSIVAGVIIACSAAGTEPAYSETAKPASADTLTIGAAHTLKGTLQGLVPIFEQEYGVRVNVIYGASHTLRRQIEHGNTVNAIDLFLPDVLEELEQLQKKGLTLTEHVHLYAQSPLVLVMASSPNASIPSWVSLGGNRPVRIGVGDPRTSFGRITARALFKNGSRFAKSSFRHAIHTDDIVNLVDSGAVDVGVVYRADAIRNGQVRIVDEQPTGDELPVRFAGSVIRTCGPHACAIANQFMAFLQTPRIQMLLLKYGFEPLSSM
ncbi:MAG TPA: molybdate ABC transporter substrate-binding protein [Nitrospirales bacterium]|nr:molybdate ABC transporter substrate-binding protein [Nitrospirales bacterium]